MAKQRQDELQSGKGKRSQPEDASMKTLMTFFAEEVLPFFKIEGQVAGYAPTELVHLELDKFLEDFTLQMTDGSWKHFEFQSTNEGLAGLKRFRVYESLASYQYKVPVTTYVLFSGQIKNPMTCFQEGVNTYRVVPLIMTGWNAESVLEDLQHRAEIGEKLSRNDLVPLALCPLMGGAMDQKTRIKTAYAITREVETDDPEDVRKIEAVIYAMAEKFLSDMDLEEVVEDMSMTRAGRMLVERGREEGMEKGREEGREEGETRINELNRNLLADNRQEDMLKAIGDKEYQNRLLEEYGLA
jgi:predicted transposase YdaD